MTVAKAMAPAPIAGRASFAAMSPPSRTFSAKTSLPPRRTRQRSIEKAVADRFAHSPNGRTLCFNEQQIGIFGERDIDGAGKPRLIEEDRFLRQPVQCTGSLNVELERQRRFRPMRAVDLLGRRGRRRQPRAAPDIDLHSQRVATGKMPRPYSPGWLRDDANARSETARASDRLIGRPAARTPREASTENATRRPHDWR